MNILRNPPQYPTRYDREAAERRATAALAHEAVQAISADKIVDVIYTAICDHPTATAAQLEELANRIGRAAHEKARHDV